MTMTRSPRFIQTHVADSVAERAAAVAALQAPAASASPKFFYDALGSKLFEAITELPEYYPTRTEAAIFAEHGAAMAEHIGAGVTLIDLGAGNCAKAVRLFPMIEPVHYVAVDISVDFLRDALRHVQREYPQLPITGLGLDFSSELTVPAELLAGRPVFFYPGSSIGNFTPDEAVKLLAGVARRSRGGGLLIGVDLVKPHDVLEAAYDDALGVTAAFNLNLLRHLNRLIGSDFEAAQWRHVGLFNAVESRIEMHLEARRDLRVQWPGGSREFRAGQRLHTENSYKHTVPSFTALLARAGFRRPTTGPTQRVGSRCSGPRPEFPAFRKRPKNASQAARRDIAATVSRLAYSRGPW
jgi:L-histidine Nalpha-methyltransferase